MVKNLPAMQETKFSLWVRKIPWSRNGNPPQYSCLENSDRGAWWATVHGVTKSWTWAEQWSKPVLYDCENNHWFLLTPIFLLIPQLLFQPNRTNWVFSHLLGSDNDLPSAYCILLLRIKVFRAWDQTRCSWQEYSHCPHWVFSLVEDTPVNRRLWCQVIIAMEMDPQGYWGTLKRDPNPAVKHPLKRW